MKAASILLSLPAVVMLAACGESFTPGELAGTYGLVSVEGTSPPFIEVATTECDQSIVDGVLELGADASHSLTLSIQLDCTRGSGQVDPTERVYAGTFTVDGNRLVLTSPQPFGGDLVFEGQAQGSFFVDLALPSTVVGLDPLLDIRFDRRRCPDICVSD
jgi:hypothetical protein